LSGAGRALLVSVALVAALAGCGARRATGGGSAGLSTTKAAPGAPAGESVAAWRSSLDLEERLRAEEEALDRPQKSFRPESPLSKRPHIKSDPREGRGLMVLADGDLREWTAAGARWIEGARPIASAKRWKGKDDLDARLAIASYPSGLSLAVVVKDDRHLPARHVSTIGRWDHLEIELWPAGLSAKGDAVERGLGLHLRLGTEKRLVEVLRPAEAWRESAISSGGKAVPGGYQVEARIPLAALAPLPLPSVDSVHYRVVVHDADETSAEEPAEGATAAGEAAGGGGGGGSSAAEATLLLEGDARLDPPMEVPEAVRRRASVRACLAAEPRGLFGYENGWHCVVPYLARVFVEDDAEAAGTVRFAHSRVPEAPTLVWIRERVLFVNLQARDAEAQRGIAALLDKHDNLLSVIRLGVVNALDPGSPITKDSGAEVVKLPDGGWAVAVVHAYGTPVVAQGQRCTGASRVYLSILALRGCLTSTPQNPAPEPESPPALEEIFRTLLEDCRAAVSNDWSLSKDRKTISVRSSLDPTRAPSTYVYQAGRYLPPEGE
jgi:hypothetical protein